MCGISGYWDFKRKLTPKELREIVHLMNNRIQHRGPDEEGIYQEDGLCMGMRRLSIIDIRGGSQPVFSEDHSIAVVYNGEIYNYKELRKELKDKGHTFSTNTDTEIIVHAFEEYGTKSFELFDGMYAFAMYDVKNETLYIVRDRMGEKPLYYFIKDDCVIFGSEMKCLLATETIDKKICTRALNQFLQLTYIPAPYTIYENIWKLRPGHYLDISKNGSIKDIEYWDIPVKTPIHLGYRNSVKYLRNLLKISVKQRMISDVSLGAFLSGGVDSASVVGLMTHVSKTPSKTFTIGSNLKEYDERNRAKKIAELNHTQHYEKVVDYKDFPSAMRMIMEYMDEPFADSSVIPVFLLAKFAKEKVTVALTGDAGDELFAGYNKYLLSYYSHFYTKIPEKIRNMLIKPVLDKIGDKKNLIRKVKKVVKNAEKNSEDCHKALMHMGVKEDEISQLMTVPYKDEGSLDFISGYYTKYPEATELQRELYTDLKVVLEGDMLVKVDRMSMLNSLETRIPFLSKDVIEFVMNLPDEYKLKGKKRKRILKDSMNFLLPEGFDKYPKSGFEVPVAEWLKNEMRDEIEQLLSKKRIEGQGIFNFEYIEKIKKEHFEGKRNRRDELWVLYIFEKWYEREGL